MKSPRLANQTLRDVPCGGIYLHHPLKSYEKGESRRSVRQTDGNLLPGDTRREQSRNRAIPKLRAI